MKYVHPQIYQMIPPASVALVDEMLHGYEVVVLPKKNRQTKSGDYRAPFRGHPHRITLNAGLNPFAALITLVHEIAHMHVHQLYGRKASPHGTHWKNHFSQLMTRMPLEDLFPAEVAAQLRFHMRSPKASTFSDHTLAKLLMPYNREHESGPVLEQIPEGATFCINGKRWFIKGPRIRTRYKCQDLKSRRYYLIHPLARVMVVSQESQ
jgi:SprT protein